MRKSLLLTLLCLIGLEAMQTAKAADEMYAVLSDGGKTMTLFYDGNRGVFGGQTDWSAWKSTVETVNFGLSMRNARPTSTVMWFYNFSKLTTVNNIQRLNTEEVTTMNMMFSGCTSLTSLDLSSFHTEKVELYVDMFSGCTSLKELNLAWFEFYKDASSTISMFENCTELTTIYCNSEWKDVTPESPLMSYHMFENCSKLVGGNGTACNGSDKINIEYARPDGLNGEAGYFTTWEGTPEPYAMLESDSKTLTFRCDNKRTYNYGEATPTPFGSPTVTTVRFDESYKDVKPISTYLWFLAFSNLETIEHLDYLNTEEVTNMSYMFSGCNKIEAIDVSHFKTGKVKDMNDMFVNCTNIKELDLRGWDMSNVTSVQNMFKNCTALETILCGKDWNEYSFSESADMFSGCTSLKGNNGTECDGTTNIDVTYARPDNGTSAPGYFTGKEIYAVLEADGTTLTLRYDFDRVANDGVLEWYDYATNEALREAVTKIVLDESIKEARPTSTAKWFYYFDLVESIEHLDYLNTEVVTDMYNMFFNCNNLETLDLSHFNTGKVTNMDGMFYNCKNLETLDVSHFKTDNVTDMFGMFKQCMSLTSLDVSHFNTGNVTNMSQMFSNCFGLKSLDLSHFKTSNVVYMDFMFENCYSMQVLDLSGFDMSSVTKVNSMFYECESLTKIICNGDWSALGGITSSDDMFEGCEKLLGSNGTTYDKEKTDIEYARTDGMGDKPGYFHDPTIEFFTVRFLDSDDELISVQVVNKGDAAVEPEEEDIPEILHYHFTGWDKAFDNVTEDLEIHALYAIDTYEVELVAEHGKITFEPSETDLTKVPYGTELVLTAIPDEGYEFISWTNYDGSKLAVTSDTTVTATFKLKEYKVKFVAEHGTITAAPVIADMDHVTHGSEFVLTATPAEGYEFVKWTNYDGTKLAVTSDTTVTATFKLKEYKVKFVAEHGTITAAPVIADMDHVTHGTELVLTAIPDEGYEFVSWTNYDGTKLVVTSDTTVTATFKIKTYEVKLATEHGKITFEPSETDLTKVAHGTELVLTAVPDEGYEFISWTNYDGTKLVVTSDTTVTAKYEVATVYYTVTYYDWDLTVLGTEKVEEGKDAKGLDPEPTREGYTFIGWSKPLTNITADLNVQALYEVEKVYYTVTYYDWDLTILGTEKVEEGKDAKGLEPEPTREGYTFTGWSKSLTNITADLSVQAMYKENPGTGVETVVGERLEARGEKVMRDGVIYIERNGQLYDLNGRMMK